MAKLRTERDDVHLVVIGKRKPGGASDETIKRLGLEDHVEFVTGVPEQRIIELYSEAELAVVPSLYEGFSLPAIEAMACGTPARRPPPAGPSPRWSARTATPPCSSSPATARRWPPSSAGRLDEPDLRGTIGARGRQRVVDHWSWKHTAVKTVEQYRIRLELED